MDFIYDLTIPAKRTQAVPLEQEVDIGAGVVHFVTIQFPKGCAGLAHGRVRQALTPRWPSNEGADYNWDNYIHEVKEHFLIRKGDAPLTLVGWNEDDTFPHTLTFRFSILPEEVMEPWRAQIGMLDKLLMLLGLKTKGGSK